MAAVTLHPVAPHHAAAIQRLAEDPRIPATTNLPEPYPPNGAAWFIGFIGPRHTQGVEYAFAIEDTGNAEIVGMCGIVMPADPAAADAVAELGYWIGVPFWGRGFATAACHTALAFLRDNTAVRTVDAFPLVDNAASRRVLEKVGMTYMGDVPNKYPKWPAERLLAHYRITLPR